MLERRRCCARIEESGEMKAGGDARPEEEDRVGRTVPSQEDWGGVECWWWKRFGPEASRVVSKRREFR